MHVLPDCLSHSHHMWGGQGTMRNSLLEISLLLTTWATATYGSILCVHNTYVLTIIKKKKKKTTFQRQMGTDLLVNQVSTRCRLWTVLKDARDTHPKWKKKTSEGEIFCSLTGWYFTHPVSDWSHRPEPAPLTLAPVRSAGVCLVFPSLISAQGLLPNERFSQTLLWGKECDQW